MRDLYEAQLATLKNDMIRMGALCEEAISAAIQGLLENDPGSAKRVSDIESEIDDFERDIERLCMRLLLKQQPVATDLRTVSSALRMISDLERIGDQAFDIADITKNQSEHKDFASKVHIKEMANAVIVMVTDSVDSYVKLDQKLAEKVATEDDNVDALFLKIFHEIAALIESGDSGAEQALDLLMITKYLERIGDHAVNVSEWMIYTLCNTGMDAKGFALPSAFWNAMHEHLPDLILLDLMLSEEGGLEILKKVRRDSKTKSLPVMILTAKGTEYDQVVGLDSGADDYITKPFGMMALVARVKAVLRRTEKNNGIEKVLIFGELEVNPIRHTVFAAGEPVSLTLKEFELLCLLLENPGIVFTRDQLLNQIWGYSFDGESRTVDVHVWHLRQKLGECGKCIETVRGIGYRAGDGNL